MRDRTGETCPSCNKGKLYPTGIKGFEEPAEEPREGITRDEFIEYECDFCHRKTRPGQTNLKAIIDETKLKKNEKTNE